MSGTVSLNASRRASELLYDVLNRARDAHPSAFEGLRWPADQRAFRRDYAATLIAFERRRLASPDRAAIARTLTGASQASMVFDDGVTQTPLADYLASPGEPLTTSTVELTQEPGLVPELTFRGEHYVGDAVAQLADHWLEQRWMTESAHRAVRWSLAQTQAQRAGRADMAGHKIVSLGAGAELAPTRAMLRAGADVLYVDTRDPSEALLRDPRVSGKITFVPGGADLLAQPREILATIKRFADGDPVHVGMYAYSGGAAQEWRLTASMNALVRAMPSELIRSVVMLVSPTTPGSVSEADMQTAQRRSERRRFKALGLGRSQAAMGQSGEWPRRVSHSIVSLQGAAYQAAQYVGKMMAAETLAVFGTGESGPGLTVSAAVAPITKTASLSHPLFDAGFEGAAVFDLLVSEPQATRVMCALLAFHDLLCPDAPSRVAGLEPTERAAAIMGEQIHGGVYAQPYSLEREIILAAALGFGRDPRLLPPALKMLLPG
jgi:hypothetical protein